MSKQNSQFNYGMQPVIFSKGLGNWSRIGDSVSYFRNHFSKKLESSYNSSGGTSDGDDTYSTLSFNIQFPSENEVYYIAYHFPYTYTNQQVLNEKFNFQGISEYDQGRRICCQANYLQKFIREKLRFAYYYIAKSPRSNHQSN